jgi:anti-sigma-K factor RskA
MSGRDDVHGDVHSYAVYDLDEMLGAYALDAVDDDERRRVEDYLRINPRAAAEVQDHREVATMLAFTGMDAPAGLWDRIASELDGTAPAPGPELAKVLPMADRPRRRAWPQVGKWVAATAAAALVAIVAVGVIDRAEAPVDPLVAAADAARADRDSRTAVLRAEGVGAEVEAIIDNDGHGFLLAESLPELGDEQTYQLWGVIGDQVISIGVLGPHPELETFTVKGEIAALAVTIERAGGVVSDGNPDGAFVGELA